MSEKQPKKMLIMNILDILRKYSDEEHKLSQRKIEDILRSEYNMNIDRKSVKRNLMDLINSGCDIAYEETVRRTYDPRTGKTGETVVLSDFYLVRDFTDGELRLLIDSLLFSRHISDSQRKDLIERLEGLSNIYFRSRMKHISTVADGLPASQQLFLTIETLDEAISKNRQVSLVYNRYGKDKKLHPTSAEQIINPYQMAASNGRYYLICNKDNYDNLAYYQLDHITEIQLLDTRRKSIKKLEGTESELDLPKHMNEHIYMFSGKSAAVTMRIERSMINAVVEWFGKKVDFYNESDTEINARVTVNLEAMRCWARQYLPYVKIISPTELVKQVEADIRKAAENYGIRVED